MKERLTDQDSRQSTEMLSMAFQNADVGVVEKLHGVRDERTKILNDQRNTMLGMATTFLGIALPLYGSLKASVWNKWCLGIAIVSDILAICMIIIAQRKLPRQMGEVVDKTTLTVLKEKAIDGEIPSSKKWYEELCVNYWGIPLVLSIVACLVAVFL